MITDDILSNLEDIKALKAETINLLLKHTSASLTINENCDNLVRSDMEKFVNDIILNKSYFDQSYEGDGECLSYQIFTFWCKFNNLFCQERVKKSNLLKLTNSHYNFNS